MFDIYENKTNIDTPSDTKYFKIEFYIELGQPKINVLQVTIGKLRIVPRLSITVIYNSSWYI